MNEKKHVVIIGAGVGGTATAARLSRQGFQVTVIEKNVYLGGRCSLLHQGDFRFDQGPSLYLMPKVFDELFADLDERIEDHLELLRCENNYKVHFHDGDLIQLSSDLARMKTEIQRIEGILGFGRFLDFLKEAHVHYTEGTPIAIKKNYASIWDLIQWRMSPYDAPAVYSLLQYTEFTDGIWYLLGGFNKVLQALETIATDKYGARFIYNTTATKINTKDRQMTGVTLETGQINQLDVHNIFLAESYQESFDKIFQHHSLPSQPSFYVNFPSRIDPTAAPPDKDAVIVLVPIGHMKDDDQKDYGELVRRARSMVLDVIHRRLGIQQFEDWIEHEMVNDPSTWQV
ncbi:hypothetical protein RO3G_01211 [Rhizopus delemar RA 99-880]|uniref:Phytoene desaturase n=1 Tax=Rhizopus delemar (strain RA 99-880 / ATCC MYA-4621 / FGSC 9543 / NRRL 43880) TaxID=246409 RepID=I1BJX7_RHIO9|nr:hypothetical protein RO3G_01211 [Rhizopus delemar RA 99-880]|eukprot:EIE76507.1 hypothetical protein RO3G_01211 [Rhizopus delemar RA 99-880]